MEKKFGQNYVAITYISYTHIYTLNILLCKNHGNKPLFSTICNITC